MYYDCKKFKSYFSRVFQILSQVNFQGILNELSDFSHVVGESFELESSYFGYGFQNESLAGVGTYFAMLTKVFVCAFKLIYCKKARNAFD